MRSIVAFFSAGTLTELCTYQYDPPKLSFIIKCNMLCKVSKLCPRISFINFTVHKLRYAT